MKGPGDADNSCSWRYYVDSDQRMLGSTFQPLSLSPEANSYYRSFPSALSITAAARRKKRNTLHTSLVGVFVMLTTVWSNMLMAQALSWTRVTALIPFNPTLQSVPRLFPLYHPLSFPSSRLNSHCISAIRAAEDNQAQQNEPELETHSHSSSAPLDSSRTFLQQYEPPQNQRQKHRPLTPSHFSTSSSSHTPSSNHGHNHDSTAAVVQEGAEPAALPISYIAHDTSKSSTMTAFCSVPVARPDTAGTNAQGCDAEGVAQPRGHQNRAPSTSSVKHQPQPQPPSQEHQEQQRAKRHASTLAGNSPDNLLRAARLRLREHSAAAPNRKVVPEPVPIGFEYTVYYPGNMDLIITAGHNGINTPGTELSPPMTHFFQPYLPSDNDKENEEVGELDPMRFAVPVEDKSRAAVRAQVGKCFPPPHAQRSPLPFSVLTHDQQDGQHRQQHYHHHHHQQQQQQQQQQPFNLDTSTVLASCVSPPLTSDTPPPQEILPPWPPTLMHDLPERNESAGGNFKGDLNTTKIAMALAQSVSDILSSTQSPTPLRPHVVLFRVHRRYVDVNRNISNPLENAVPEASPKSAAAWHEYHGVIDHVRAVIESRNNRNRNIFGTQRGLLLDIHGHTHATEMIEIGYLLDSDKLSLEDAALNAAAKEFAPIMSIRSLIDRWWEEQQQLNANPPSSVAAPPPPSSLRPSAASFASVLRGSHDSLGGMLQRQGLNSVPGPQNRAPCDACLFFFGGYTIQRHGSRDSGAIDAIQLELPRSLRLRTRDELQEITWRMGQAVTEFLSLYYDLEADHRIVPAFAFEEKSPSSMHELHKRTTTALVSPRKAIHVRSSKKQQQHRLHRSRSAVSLTSSEKGGANESGDESDLEESMNQPPSDHSTAVYAELPSTRPALLRKSSRL